MSCKQYYHKLIIKLTGKNFEMGGSSLDNPELLYAHDSFILAVKEILHYLQGRCSVRVVSRGQIEGRPERTLYVDAGWLSMARRFFAVFFLFLLNPLQFSFLARQDSIWFNVGYLTQGPSAIRSTPKLGCLGYPCDLGCKLSPVFSILCFQFKCIHLSLLLTLTPSGLRLIMLIQASNSLFI